MKEHKNAREWSKTHSDNLTPRRAKNSPPTNRGERYIQQEKAGGGIFLYFVFDFD